MPRLIIVDVTPTLVDRTTGTNIGNMTSNGGLAAAFDGATNRAAAACAALSASSGYCGKTFSSGKVVYYVDVYGSNNFGYSTTGAITITLDLYGRNGTPSSGTDGTLLGTISFTNLSDESTARRILSTDKVNSYTSVFVNETPSGSFSNLIAELAITELL